MRAFVLAAGLALAGVAHAGHEFPFYPSFYPQEITVEALDARAAAERLDKGTLHVYAGAEPAHANPARTAAVTSLGGYVVARLDDADCLGAQGLNGALAAGQTWHPYPVTPFHDDYLHHADRAEAARAHATADKRSVRGRVEIVEVTELMARAGVRSSDGSAPPWLRQGWFHAYLLLAPAAPDARIETVARRLMRGDYRDFEERINLERGLVAALQGVCGRAVLGYTERRETYSTEYAAGVENVGRDAFAGVASPIFPRTVKLRDFPWNGWLSVATPAPPASAWNPLGRGGFADVFGRLVWSALADPAFLPAPHGAGWIENRAHAPRRSASRLVYRVHVSAFHDGTPMSPADILYAQAFAAHPRVKSVRLLRTETETLAFGEDKLVYQVPVFEVRLDRAAAGDENVAPPWSTLPWHLVALFEEGARRGLLALADFDPVRDATVVRGLADVARELEDRAYVPPRLKAHVKANEARERYRRLREFHAARGHWLVTNGPYLLERWDGAKAVLAVFRDPSYPKGLGSFNAHAVPLKAYVTRVERRGAGAEVQLEAERLEREARDVRIVRGAVQEKQAPVCRYLLLARDGTAAAAGQVRARPGGRCVLALTKAGNRLMVSAILDDAAANAPINILPWDPERR